MGKSIVRTASLLFVVLLSCGSIQSVFADQTTGGVNWLDPLGYAKPAFRPLTVPTPGANQYWVDLAGGSGTTCTATSPCSWASVQGKPGTQGGGAVIYIKNSGPIGSPTLFGTAGNEVVIKPWNDTTLATITGRNNWTTRIQYVIFDGGPNLSIKFNNTGIVQARSVETHNGVITLSVKQAATKKRSLMDFVGATRGVYGQNAAQVAQYLDSERDTWDR